MNILELLIILIVALIAFKPKDLPKIAHQLGKLIANARKLTTQAEEYLHHEIKQQQLQINMDKANQAEIKQLHD